MDVDIFKLEYYLQLSLGKQIIHIEILENIMRELDKKGCYQISFTEVESVLHKYNIQVDKMVLARSKEAARTTGVSNSIYSISKFIQMLQAATNSIHMNYKI